MKVVTIFIHCMGGKNVKCYSNNCVRRTIQMAKLYGYVLFDRISIDRGRLKTCLHQLRITCYECHHEHPTHQSQERFFYEAGRNACNGPQMMTFSSLFNFSSSVMPMRNRQLFSILNQCVSNDETASDQSTQISTDGIFFFNVVESNAWRFFNFFHRFHFRPRLCSYTVLL